MMGFLRGKNQIKHKTQLPCSLVAPTLHQEFTADNIHGQHDDKLQKARKKEFHGAFRLSI
jgi:hypothetical protein